MSIRIIVLFFRLPKPIKIDGQEPTCSRFDNDERVLKELLEFEGFVHDLEAQVKGFKVLYHCRISNLEDKLEEALKTLQESWNVLLFAISIPFATASQEPMCSKFDYDERILRKLLMQERLIQDLEVKVGELKLQYESQQESCKDSIRAAKANVVQIPQVEQDGWELVFRGTAGNGDSIVDAWLKGTSVTTDKPINMKRSHDKHYLNLNYVNNWSSKNITRVKFALYYTEMEIASVLFSAKGTTRESWFLKKNILNSSWSSLTKTESLNILGVDEYPARSFYISKSHGGCNKDTGYAVLADVSKSRPCDWETHPSYPMFLYSKSNGPTVWNKFLYGMADYIAVFVQY